MLRLGPFFALLVEAAGHVGARLLLALGLHPLGDVAAAVAGRTGLAEPLVLAAATEHLGAGLDAGLEVEDHRVVLGADEDRVALLGAHLGELDSTPIRLSRSARKPTASSLLKSVWRTQRSGLAPRTRHPSSVARTSKSAPPSTASAAARCARLGARARPRGTLDDLGHRERQLAQARAGRGADLEDPQAAAAQLLDDHVGDVLAVGHVDLVEATSRGRSSRPP